MPVMTKFVDFLRTGKLGPIGVGSTRIEVLKYFGRPEHIWYGRHGEVCLYYGAVEIGFLKPSLNAKSHYIQVEKFKNIRNRRHIGYGGLQISDISFPLRLENTDYFLRFARQNGIRLRRIVRPVIHDICYISSGNVLAVSDDENPSIIVTYVSG